MSGLAILPALVLPPAEISVPRPRVLTETWRPLTFTADGQVHLGTSRIGPTPGDVMFSPIAVRLTDDQLDNLFMALGL